VPQGNIKSVNVHPVVLFSILDHHSRRKEDQDRVIGTLLGYSENGVVFIRNCFPVPHTEGEQVGVDQVYHQSMFELHQKANFREEIIGWYSSSSEINEHTVLIHNFYGKESEQPPVHLCIGTSLENGRMDISAYVSEALGRRGDSTENSFGLQFQPLKVSFADEKEFTGLSALLTSKKDDLNQTTTISETTNIRTAFLSLLRRVEVVSHYVDDVVAGKIKPDRKIGRFLAETMETSLLTDVEDYQKLYHNSVQDHLMTIYISNLMKTQLHLAKKLESIAV
jgi:translation initiation factor 3 subunit F